MRDRIISTAGKVFDWVKKHKFAVSVPAAVLLYDRTLYFMAGGEAPWKTTRYLAKLPPAKFHVEHRDVMEPIRAYLREPDVLDNPFLLVTGENGVGKSTAIRQVLREEAAGRVAFLQVEIDNTSAATFNMRAAAEKALKLGGEGDISTQLEHTRVNGKPLVLYIDVSTKHLNLEGARRVAENVAFFAKSVSYQAGAVQVIVEWSCTQASDHTLHCLRRAQVHTVLIPAMDKEFFLKAAADPSNCKWNLCKNREALDMFYDLHGGRFRDLTSAMMSSQDDLEDFKDIIKQEYNRLARRVASCTPNQLQLLKRIAAADDAFWPKTTEEEEGVMELLALDVPRGVIMRVDHEKVKIKNPSLRKAVMEATVSDKQVMVSLKPLTPKTA